MLITYGVIQFSYNYNNSYNKILKFQCHKNQMFCKGSASVFQKLFIIGYGQLKKIMWAYQSKTFNIYNIFYMSGVLHVLFNLITPTTSCELVLLLLFPRQHSNYEESLSSANSRALS